MEVAEAAGVVEAAEVSAATEVVVAAVEDLAVAVAAAVEDLEVAEVEVEAAEVPKLLLLNLIVTKEFLLLVVKKTLWSP